MPLTSNISHSVSYVTPQEFEDMEMLLGRLLQGANARETQLLLHIHQRLIKIIAAQTTNQSTRDRLISLAT